MYLKTYLFRSEAWQTLCGGQSIKCKTIMNNFIKIIFAMFALFLIVFLPNTAKGQQSTVVSAICIPSSCNLVTNGSFEAGAGCGSFNAGTLGCWRELAGTPDLFVRGCSNPNNPPGELCNTGTGV